MQKNYLYIGKSLMLTSAIRRCNKKFDSQIRMHHLRILYLLKGTSWPPLRVEILRRHRFFSCKMNYTLLNKALFFLEKENLVSTWDNNGFKSYKITPAGIELLTWLEKQVRKAPSCM